MKYKYVKRYGCPNCGCETGLINEVVKRQTDREDTGALEVYDFKNSLIFLDACPKCGNIFMREFRIKKELKIDDIERTINNRKQ